MIKRLFFILGIIMALGATARITEIVRSASPVPDEKSERKEIRRVVKTGNFTDIVSVGSTDIIVRQGPLKVELFGSQENLDKLEVKISPTGALTVKLKPGVNHMQGDTRLCVSLPDLEKILVNGSGDIILSGSFKVGRLTLVSNGSGDIVTEEVSGTALKITGNGSGDVRIESFRGESLAAVTNGSGDILIENGDMNSLTLSSHGSGDIRVDDVTSRSAELVTTGNGDIEAFSLKARSLKGTSTGSGDICCTGTDVLTLTCTGSGEITYRGTPRQTHFSGRGDITRD